MCLPDVLFLPVRCLFATVIIGKQLSAEFQIRGKLVVTHMAGTRTVRME
jgi:hypothetical protein